MSGNERLSGLLGRQRFARSSRLHRMLVSPWRMVYPKLLRRLGARRATLARTFWGGTMEVVLPESISTRIWQYGFFEADVCRFLLAVLEPGMVFVDVGAHFGFFTLLGSDVVGPTGRVVAVEPMPQAFTQLTRNVTAHAGARNTHALRCAAFSADTTLEFQEFGEAGGGLSSAFAARSETGLTDSMNTVTVEARTCDALVAEVGLDRVDVVKIDAESSELHVLQGMEGLITRGSPKIILEVGDFDLPGVASSGELVRWLLARGYRAYELSDAGLVPHVPIARYASANLLFAREGMGKG